MISAETRFRIQQVASVCIRCRRCMKECIMLNRFSQNPKALFEEYLEKGPENMDRAIAYSCNECSQCTLKCPKGLNLKAVFQSLKEDYAAENQGIVPLAALLPSEQGQKKECDPAFCTALSAGSSHSERAKAKYLFIPGKFPPDPILNHLRDSLGAHNVAVLPQAVLETVGPEAFSYLKASDCETLITVCPSSYRSLKEAFPERKVLFYWDLMQDLIGIPQEVLKTDVSLHLQGETGSSVRWVLSQLGYESPENEPRNPNLSAADHDCRQVLGLLFGEKTQNTVSCPEA